MLAFYSLLSGIFFYLYVFCFLFKKGYFAFLSPLKPFKKADDFLGKIIMLIFNFHGGVFPHWKLFIGMSNEKFYDVVAECEFYGGDKKVWIGTEDLCFGSFEVRNKFFILSLISHYKNNQKDANAFILKHVRNFAEKENKIINQVIINQLPFSLSNIQQDRSLARSDEKRNKTFLRKQFVWQNRKSPFFKRTENNIYELY